MAQGPYEKISQQIRKMPRSSRKIAKVCTKRFLGLAERTRDPPGPQIHRIGPQTICLPVPLWFCQKAGILESGAKRCAEQSFRILRTKKIWCRKAIVSLMFSSRKSWSSSKIAPWPPRLDPEYILSSPLARPCR